jgi:nucleoid-associated protein YgaU
MKNTTPILVLTGLAIVAAVGIAGLTREQWLGQPTPAVATPETAPAPAAEPTAEQPAAPADTTAAAQPEQAQEQTTAAQPEQTPAAQPEQAPAGQQAAAVQLEATTQPEATNQPETATQPEAGTETGTQPAPNASETKVVPAFDTVRVEKSGEAVIAGRAEAGAEVVVKLNGEEIGKTVANNDGAFVLIPEKPLPAGSGAITIEATGKSDAQPVASTESVAVIVPEGQQQKALVAVVSPEAPTKVLQTPEAAPETPAAEQPAEAAAPAAEEPAAEQKPAKLVSIDAVDYDTAGNIVFSGQGEAGNTARIYVDNTFLGDAPVGEDGRWTYSGTADIAQGVHTLRVDGLDGKGNVVNRVEVPFFREDQTKVASAAEPAAPVAEQTAPAEPAQTPEAAPQAETAAGAPAAETETTVAQPAETVAEQPAAEQPAAQPPASADAGSSQMAEQAQPAEAPVASATVEETVAATAASGTAASTPREGRIVIQPGNNLWRISRVLYGSGNKFTMLYEANKDQIRDPNLIYPGQVFRTPEVTPKGELIDPRRREPLGPDENDPAAQ